MSKSFYHLPRLMAQQHISLNLCLAILLFNPQLIRGLFLHPVDAWFDSPLSNSFDLHSSHWQFTLSSIPTLGRSFFYALTCSTENHAMFTVHSRHVRHWRYKHTGLGSTENHAMFTTQQPCQTPEIQTHKAWSQTLILSDYWIQVWLSCKVC